jgi:hypothetical protein
MRTLCLPLALLVSLAGACREPATPSQAPAPGPSSTASRAAAPRVVGGLVSFPAEDTTSSARVVYYATAELPAARLHTKGAAEVQVHQTSRRIAGTDRWVYRYELAGLAPGAEVEVELRAGDEALAPPRRFRTLPATGPVRVVFGGDLYSSPTTERLLRLSAAQDAHALVLGGDLAYANGKPDAYPLWDRLLTLFDRALVREDGTTVPIIAAIGNHEVDWTLAGNPVPENAPFYMALFAPDRPRGGAGETFFAHTLSDHTALLVLDSGHMVTHASQVAFIDAVLTRHARTPLKLATYHVPLWPSYRPLDTRRSALGREHWGPRFDAHGLHVALENHDHALKRTKRLKGGKPDERGTLYLGDGCMGNSERPPDPTRPYLDHAAGLFHVWVADLAATGATFRALSPAGEELDRATVTVAPARGATGAPPTVTPAE